MNIEKVYVEIATLTLSHCTRTCSKLGSCCEKSYCDMAIDYAKQMFDINLQVTENAKLPLLGTDGKCSAAPHLRPLCSRHSCDISSLGWFKEEPVLTEQYFQLTGKASVLEYEVYLAANEKPPRAAGKSPRKPDISGAPLPHEI